MSFVALGTLGATALGAGAGGAAVAGSIAGATYAGYNASKVDTQGGVDAAGNVSMAERAQMGKDTKFAVESVQNKTDTLLDMATTKGQTAMSSVFDATQMLAGSDFETSEADASRVESGKSAVYGDYKKQVDNILAEDDISKKGINLGDQRKSAAIDDRYNRNVAAVTSTADTFLEGFTGQSNYKVR